MHRFISEREGGGDDVVPNLEPSSSSSQCQGGGDSALSSKRKRIVEAEVEENTNKWIIKSPYSGNMLHFHHTVHDSVGATQFFTKTVIPKINQGVCYKLPYLMFQEKLVDAREAKLCFFNKSFRHFCSGILVILVCYFKLYICICSNVIYLRHVYNRIKQ